jgi:hypothetical protein
MMLIDPLELLDKSPAWLCPLRRIQGALRQAEPAGGRYRRSRTARARWISSLSLRRSSALSPRFLNSRAAALVSYGLLPRRCVGCRQIRLGQLPEGHRVGVGVVIITSGSARQAPSRELPTHVRASLCRAVGMSGALAIDHSGQCDRARRLCWYPEWYPGLYLALLAAGPHRLNWAVFLWSERRDLNSGPLAPHLA